MEDALGQMCILTVIIPIFALLLWSIRTVKGQPSITETLLDIDFDEMRKPRAKRQWQRKDGEEHLPNWVVKANRQREAGIPPEHRQG